MNHFLPIELAGSQQPLLIVDERLLVVQDNVGLFDGVEKNTKYGNGKLYLTSHRIIYVDSKQPGNHSIALDLKLVRGLEYMTGLFKSSRKIILHFSFSNDNEITQASFPATWICPSCSFGNTARLALCQLCGEKQPETPPLSPTLKNTFSQDSSIERPCHACTYMNKPTLPKCELCGAGLTMAYLDQNEVCDLSGVKTSEEVMRGSRTGEYVRLSFKKGGCSAFFEKLQVAMTMKVWEDIRSHMQRKSHTPSRSNTATSDNSNQRSAGNNNNNTHSNSNNSNSSNNNNVSNSTVKGLKNEELKPYKIDDNRGESQQQQHYQQQHQQQQHHQQQHHQQQHHQQQHQQASQQHQQQKGLEWALGLSIRVKTLTDEEYEGQIYAYDTKTNCVNATSNDATNTTTSVFATTFPSVSYVQMERIQAREMQAYRETQAFLARIGVGVTVEAQEIFDALSKTLPVRWAEEKIVVLDEVVINPPYDLENCKANSSASGSLARVKKVLEGEKKRLSSVRK
ncbi:5710_t:CDS:2 [Ambispora leptoticha]|uniref:5710_t:CDS:1 n=1 Tax=Ambispora leptoticha TaxID=144679 RepID=A0A9N9CC05_9GLOM|nr:5710_t:CDS:2 [Ambispora leptoticha]